MIVFLHKYDKIIHELFGRTRKYKYIAYLGIFKTMTKYDKSYLHKNEYDKFVIFCRTKAVSQFLGLP